eukprot:scaffold3.g6699.t1
MEMDAASLRAVCKERKLYLTPRLNERLYANARGFKNIAGLEEYTALKALHLDGNAIDSLAGLPPLPDLKCLFLQNNQLESLDAGVLSTLPSLDTLNISSNSLTDLAGLHAAPKLRSLLAAGNELRDAAALAPLARLPLLEALDLQGNQLHDPEGLIQVLQAIPSLKCLYLKGCPFVSSMHNYRKRLVAALPALTYLDERPVFEAERRCAEAWARGGLEAERTERAACMREKEAREHAAFEALQRMREEGFRKQREALGLPPGTTDPFFDTLELPADGREEKAQLDEEEPPELQAARRRLAAGRAAADAGSKPQDPLLGAAAPATEAAAGAGEEELPPLSEADLAAVLEESQARRAELVAEAAPQHGQSGGAESSPRVENGNPNAAGAGANAAPAAAPTPVVPPARRTVTIKAGCGGPDADDCGAQAPRSACSKKAAEGAQCQAALGPPPATPPLLELDELNELD